LSVAELGRIIYVRRKLTGSATDTEVASIAQARLTTAMEVKAARSLHPGLNFSALSSSDSVMFGEKLMARNGLEYS
jgi:hypothetical protein